MAEFGILEIEREYEFTVRDIKENATPPFVSQKPLSKGQKFHCHHFIMQDEDKVPYLCQICEPKETQNYCNVGDVMTFRVKSFTREVHTIEFIARDGKQIKAVAHIPGPDTENVNSKTNSILNPIRVIALQCAVTYYTNRLEGSDDVFSKAAQFEKYLTNQF